MRCRDIVHCLSVDISLSLFSTLHLSLSLSLPPSLPVLSRSSSSFYLSERICLTQFDIELSKINFSTGKPIKNPRAATLRCECFEDGSKWFCQNQHRRKNTSAQTQKCGVWKWPWAKVSKKPNCNIHCSHIACDVIIYHLQCNQYAVRYINIKTFRSSNFMCSCVPMYQADVLVSEKPIPTYRLPCNCACSLVYFWLVLYCCCYTLKRESSSSARCVHLARCIYCCADGG